MVALRGQEGVIEFLIVETRGSPKIGFPVGFLAPRGAHFLLFPFKEKRGFGDTCG